MIHSQTEKTNDQSIQLLQNYSNAQLSSLTLLGGCHQGGGNADSTAPVAESLQINSGATSTSNRVVTPDMVATDDVAVTDYYASESSVAPQASESGWQSYQQSVSFTLSGSETLGVFPRTVYVWFKDAAGNVSESLDASISLAVYDTTAPTAVSVVIDVGADNTTSSSVTLTLSATDDQAVTNYYASESAATPQAGDSGWDNYSTSVSYSFDNATAETKTVNVWFKDAAGNASGNVNDTIELLEVGAAGIVDWIKQLGTSSDDRAYGITTDSSGNVYVTGRTSGDLDNITNAGQNDLFVVKYDSAGDRKWTKQLGTASLDYAEGITTDSSGNVYVTGYTLDALDNNTNAGSFDLIVVKFK